MVNSGVIVSSKDFQRRSNHENQTIQQKVTISNVTWGRDVVSKTNLTITMFLQLHFKVNF